MRKPWRRLTAILFVLTLAAAGLFGDRLLAVTPETRSGLKAFTELLTLLHDRYGRAVTYSDLVDASIQGMLRTLDPHTSYLSAEAYANMRERQQSSFQGLGILVGMRDGNLTVITPLEGTPAARLGIRAGDVISSIEGEPTDKLTVNEAVRRLKGPKGTKVTITILRPGFDQPLELTITRAEIPQNTVRYAYMMTPTVGYIALSDFTRSTGREMADAIRKLKEEGMQELLLDLRGNGGGLLDQAIDVADQFLPEGSKIVETHGRIPESHQEYFAEGRHPALDEPVIVLVSGATASAAEILAGAIQDHDVGLIVGTPTWGKGLVQTVYSLGYGAGLALTTAKYYTPSGRLIQRDYTSWYDYYEHSEEGSSDAPAEETAPPKAFRTDLGREVYGGGGISPDVPLSPPERTVLLDYLQAHNAFFNFAVEYANRHPVEDPRWRPGADLLERFRAWAEAQDLATPDELAALDDRETADFVLHQIHAEIFNSAFGMEARHRILAEIDPQIQGALQHFDEAGALLAERRSLEDELEAQATASAALN